MKTSKFVVAATVAALSFVATAEIKVGIIGLDTSHALRFSEIMNVKKPDFAKDFRMVAAYQWGSKDIISATNRYPAYIKEMTEKYHVEIVKSIDELIAKVDCVCLETNDGREHFWQAEKVFKSGKLCFIDKPIAHNLTDAKKIYDLGKELNARYFSSSALRYSKIAQDCRAGKYGKVIGAQVYSPSPLEVQGTHQRYTWYGIHGFEPLVTVMGLGAESVVTVHNGSEDVTVVKYADGRIGTVRSRQQNWDYGGTIFTSGKTAEGKPAKPVTLEPAYEGYEPLLKEICKFFKTGVVPVPPEETLEIFAIMEAAGKSLEHGGAEVSIAEVLDDCESPLWHFW